jgi:hypothetical protein
MGYGDYIYIYEGDIPVEKITPPMVAGLAGMSDQRSYWKYGYPAIMINDTGF